MRSKLKTMTSCSAIIIGGVDLKLCTMIRDDCLHDRSISMFCFLYSVMWLEWMGSKIKILNCYSVFIIKDGDMKLHRMREHWRHFDQSISTFWCPVTWHWNMTRDPKFELLYLLYYWIYGFWFSLYYDKLTRVSRLYDVSFLDLQSCVPEIE